MTNQTKLVSLAISLDTSWDLFTAAAVSGILLKRKKFARAPTKLEYLPTRKGYNHNDSQRFMASIAEMQIINVNVTGIIVKI